jgi:hypothetical protein
MNLVYNARMKKTPLLFAATLLVAITLSACQPRTPSLEDRIAEAMKEATQLVGVVEPLELSIYKKGTHQLKLDDGTTVTLQSRSINLGQYLEKRVTVEGKFETDLSEEKVFSVTKITQEEGEGSGEKVEFKSVKLGLVFSHPATWGVAAEGSKVVLSHNESERIAIESISTTQTLEDYVKEKETGEATAVTIAGQKSLRLTEGENIRVYIPNTAQGKIYKLSFTAGEDPEEKNVFYDVLASFQMLFSKKLTGDPCGGEEKKTCQEGFRCEITDEGVPEAGKPAEGICVSLDDTGECPFVPVPTDCQNYKVKASTKEGCPTSYECVIEGADSAETPVLTAEPEKEEEAIKLLVSTIEEYRATLLKTEFPKLVQYELSAPEKLIAVVYDADKKRQKTLFSYTFTNGEYQFTEKAHFEKGETVDWVLISGKNTQLGLQKTVIKASVSASTAPASTGTATTTEAAEAATVSSEPISVSPDMRLYENSFKNFTIEYPKNWYYKSFGAVEGAEWVTGFSDQSIDLLVQASVTLRIMSGQPKTATDDLAHVTRPRDEGTYFELIGPASMKDTLEKMADSLSTK